MNGIQHRMFSSNGRTLLKRAPSALNDLFFIKSSIRTMALAELNDSFIEKIRYPRRTVARISKTQNSSITV